MPRAPGRSEQSTREESGANAADGSRRSGTPAGDKPRPPHRIYPRTETAIGTGYRSGISVRVRGCSASAKSTATNGTAVKRRNRKDRDANLEIPGPVFFLFFLLVFGHFPISRLDAVAAAMTEDGDKTH